MNLASVQALYRGEGKPNGNLNLEFDKLIRIFSDVLMEQGIEQQRLAEVCAKAILYAIASKAAWPVDVLVTP